MKVSAYLRTAGVKIKLKRALGFPKWLLSEHAKRGLNEPVLFVIISLACNGIIARFAVIACEQSFYVNVR